MFAKWFFPAALLFVLGCNAKPHQQSIRGSVQQNGKALAEARVVWHAINVSNASPAKPQGLTDAAGQYTVVVNSTDAAPAVGTYAITVELRAPRTVGEDTVRDGKNLLPAINSKPQSTPFKQQITAETQEVPVLMIK
jgi:hypothetical protein